jgi:hypothetical protein
MQRVGNLQQSVVCECFADERHAKRKAIGLQTRWHCDCGQVEQVDEVCVITKIAVQLDWRMPHFFDGVVRRRSRQHQKIDILQHPGCFSTQCFQCVLRIEGLHGAVAACAGDNRAHSRLHGVGMFFEEALQCSQAFRTHGPL